MFITTKSKQLINMIQLFTKSKLWLINKSIDGCVKAAIIKAVDVDKMFTEYDFHAHETQLKSFAQIVNKNLSIFRNNDEIFESAPELEKFLKENFIDIQQEYNEIDEKIKNLKNINDDLSKQNQSIKEEYSKSINDYQDNFSRQEAQNNELRGRIFQLEQENDRLGKGNEDLLNEKYQYINKINLLETSSRNREISANPYQPIDYGLRNNYSSDISEKIELVNAIGKLKMQANGVTMGKGMVFNTMMAEIEAIERSLQIAQSSRDFSTIKSKIERMQHSLKMNGARIVQGTVNSIMFDGFFRS